MYRCDCIRDLKADMNQTLEQSILVTEDMLKKSIFRRFFCALVRIYLRAGAGLCKGV